MKNNLYSVRWAISQTRGEFNYTKWHVTGTGNFTLCKLPIILASKNGTFLPDIEDDTSKTNCKKCLRRLNEMEI
jgi:hypothetical protein